MWSCKEHALAGRLPNHHTMPRSGWVAATLSGTLVAVAHGKPHTDHLQLSYCSSIKDSQPDAPLKDNAEVVASRAPVHISGRSATT
ncbi:hypothetical protein AC578_5999 [Pseudocercospora eumusae]|uniref:Uncharacterized protein n=1 Tax=Pseudocercospora eumusae TaxID=321146 RepID=A0A139HVU1_9PEZI|nr:hypothetical protein AC578_5999 [Pseudocercospora eumusae]